MPWYFCVAQNDYFWQGPPDRPDSDKPFHFSGSTDFNMGTTSVEGNEMLLRNRRVPNRNLKTKPGRGGLRNYKQYVYPSSIGDRIPGLERKGMPSSLTDKLLASAVGDPTTASIARSVAPLQGGANQLKAAGASRNHILADSRIRKILFHIFSGSYNQIIWASIPMVRAIGQFFIALCGDGRGQILYRRFREACRQNAVSILEEVCKEACLGERNIRIGLAQENSDITNEFDPIVIDGRMDERSVGIRDAVLNLASEQLIPFQLAIDSLAVVKDRWTHHDVTSSVLSSSSSNVTGSRTLIDPFAPPFNSAAHQRPLSTPPRPLTGASVSNPVHQPAREFHHGARGPHQNKSNS